MTTWVDDAIRETIQCLARVRPALETGGAAYGWRDGDDVVIAYVSGPGRRGIRRRSSFELDPRDSMRASREVHDTSEGRYRFVGTWHTHPGGTASPSSVDTRAALQLASDAQLELPEPTLLIASTAAATGEVDALCGWRWDPLEAHLHRTEVQSCAFDRRLIPSEGPPRRHVQ